jgi:hypothetical protein
MRVREGELVSLTVRSDAADEVHLHGYELSAELKPGSSATLAFSADKSGRFEIELHRSGLHLGTLEVAPASR